MNELIENFRQLVWLDDPLGLLVNLVILALFALGSFDVVRALKVFAGERRRINQARERLQSGQCPKDSPSSVIEFLGVPERGLLGRRIARVMQLRGAGVGQRNLLRRLTAERLEGYGALARYIGVTLTLLGLLGTVFGMSFALFKIQGALASVNDEAGLQALVTALGETLRGMKTAFGCTLLGLLTAILISYLNYRVRRRQSAVIHMLEEFILCELLPVLQKVDPDADDAARIFAQVVVDSADELDKSRSNIAAAAKEFQEACGVTAAAAGEMKLAVQNFGQQISSVAGNQQVFTETLQATQQALHKMTDVVTRQYEDVRAFTEQASQLLDQRLTLLEENVNANRALQENLRQLTESFGPAVLGYHEQFEKAVEQLFAEFKTTLNQTLAEVSGLHRERVTEHLSASQKAFDEALTRHQTGLDSLINQNQQGLSEMFGAQRAALHDLADMVMDARGDFGAMSANFYHDNHRDGHVAARNAVAAAEGGQR